MKTCLDKVSSLFGFTILAILFLAPRDTNAQAHPAISNLTAQAFSQTVHTDYLLFLPKEYPVLTSRLAYQWYIKGTNQSAAPTNTATATNSSQGWPVIVFLHGIGESGTNVWKTAVHGPLKYIEKHSDFPFIVVCPQCPVGQNWSDETVISLLDEVIAKYTVDTNRVYLTGLSMGGFGAWSLATSHPDRFAAAAPICGGDGMMGVLAGRFNKEHGDALRSLPIWAFHGGKDPIVSLAESERMVEAIKNLGSDEIKLTIYPEAAHDSWTETYDNPELYRWFLDHHR
jgi:predicted peptidase